VDHPEGARDFIRSADHPDTPLGTTPGWGEPRPASNSALPPRKAGAAAAAAAGGAGVGAGPSSAGVDEESSYSDSEYEDAGGDPAP